MNKPEFTPEQKKFLCDEIDAWYKDLATKDIDSGISLAFAVYQLKHNPQVGELPNEGRDDQKKISLEY